MDQGTFPSQEASRLYFCTHEQNRRNRLWKKAYWDSCERYYAVDRKRIDNSAYA